MPPYLPPKSEPLKPDSAAHGEKRMESSQPMPFSQRVPGGGLPRSFSPSIYDYGDFMHLQSSALEKGPSDTLANSIEKLLQRDLQREKDGFPRKIKLGKIVRPGPGGKTKVILVPTVVEEKFIHDNRKPSPEESSSSGGSGEGQEGDVIGEEPVRGEQGAGTGGPGQGEGEEHEVESNAYAIGRILTQNLELPNLKDKGKKKFLKRYTYDLTDRQRGFGQVLDKKASLRRILETNIGLGRVPDVANIDTTSFLVSPQDHIYRILSREKELESQALVFFLRDYSGSMSGRPTEIIATQHLLIYSWLTYQYEQLVETRFVLHDTDAREVPDFNTYISLSIAGGTRVESAYRMVNEIVEAGNLARDYNIYIFHGTDGDDWDGEGVDTIAQIQHMMSYCSRMGLTIATAGSSSTQSTLEKVIAKSGLQDRFPEQFRMDVIQGDDDESRLIEGLKKLLG